LRNFTICVSALVKRYPEGPRPMWIYTMYAGMSTGKYNDK